MKTLYHIEHEYEIDLGLLDDSDLFEELEERGYDVVEEGTKALIEEIYNTKKLGKPYNHLLEKLIEETTGRIL
jgi:heme oxygenase